MSAKVITHRVRVKTLKLAYAKNRAVIVEHSAKSGNAAAILCRMEVEVSVGGKCLLYKELHVE